MASCRTLSLHSPLSSRLAHSLQSRKLSTTLLNTFLGGAFPALYFSSKMSTRFSKAPQRPNVLAFANYYGAAVVTEETWEKLVLNSGLPVLVEFYANWCGPCRMVHRVVDEIAVEYVGRLNCFLLNTDNDPDLAEHFKIKAVPTVVLFKNGERREIIAGTMPKSYYVAAIDRLLES